jgi:hypothetical protein
MINSTTNIFSHGPVVPSIRLGYAPSDQPSPILDSKTSTGNMTSNILEDPTTEQTAFEYVDGPVPLAADCRLIHQESTYNSAIQVVTQPVLPDSAQLQTFGWAPSVEVPAPLNHQSSPTSDYFSPVDVRGADGLYANNVYCWNRADHPCGGLYLELGHAEEILPFR